MDSRSIVNLFPTIITDQPKFGEVESRSCPDTQLCTAVNRAQRKSEINHLKQGSPTFFLHQVKCMLYR